MNIVHNKKKPYDIYIGRENVRAGLPASKWGNPWVIGMDGTREEVIAKYEEYLPTQKHLMESLHELDGKILGCWCDYPNEDCHGRVLLEARKKQIQAMKPVKVKLAIVGSSSFDDKERIFKLLDKNRDRIEYIILGGGGEGADEFARQWAEERGFPCMTLYARLHDEKGEFDKGAVFKRNWAICRAADEVLAFWDGHSKGTAHNFEVCESIKKKITILRFTPKPKPEPVAGQVEPTEKKRRGRPKKIESVKVELKPEAPKVAEVKVEAPNPTIGELKALEEDVVIPTIVKPVSTKVSPPQESSVEI